MEPKDEVGTSVIYTQLLNRVGIRIICRETYCQVRLRRNKKQTTVSLSLLRL